MPKKVYELAKELGVASKELLEKAKKLGINVETHMSVLSDTDVKRLSAKGNNPKPAGKAVPGQVSGRVGPVGRPIVDDSYFENKRKARQEGLLLMMISSQSERKPERKQRRRLR
jgi:translation initiation factor IF-2